MRIVYFALAALLGIMGLILAFENIMIQSNGLMIFFEPMTGSIFWPIVLILMVGFLTGLFTGLGILSQRKNQDNFSGTDL